MLVLPCCVAGWASYQILTKACFCAGSQSDLAGLIRQAELIVWDEALMMARHVHEAMHCTLRNIMKIDAPFGGKLMVLGGNFRLVLPVIPRAGPAEVVAACINRASFWPLVRVLRLRQNMRVSRLEQQDEDALELRNWAHLLEHIGDGREPATAMGGVEDCVRLPDAICLPHDACTGRGLIDSIFGEGRWDDTVRVTKRAILAARNEEVDRVHDAVFARFLATGPDLELLSGHRVDAEGDQNGAYPVEFLNSLTPSRLPPHTLRLRKGMPIMLVRNLNGARGLANGTRALDCPGGPQACD